MEKQILIVFLIIFIILEFFNISIFFLDENFPTYAYSQLKVIKLFNWGSVFLDLAILIILIIKINFINLKPNKLNLVLIFLFIIGLLLIWGEIIYSTVFYYGGIGNHQGLPTDINNLGLIGSTIIFQYFIIIIINKLVTVAIQKLVWNIILFIFNLLIHYQLYNFFTPA